MALKPLLLATQPFYSAHHVLRIGATPPESRADIRRLIRLDFCVFFLLSAGRRRVSFVKVLGGSVRSSRQHDCRFLWLLRMGNLIGGHYSYAQITLTFPLLPHTTPYI